MIVTIEISVYPLTENYSTPVDLFIEMVSNKGLKVEPGKMSSLITGELSEVMRVLENTMNHLMSIYPCVFNFKISNACPI